MSVSTHFVYFAAVFKIIAAIVSNRYGILPEIELGNMNNSTDISSTTNVRNKQECAMRCELLGTNKCQAFNVWKNGQQMRCETFVHRPINWSNIVTQEGVEFYEKQCEGLCVLASAQESLADGRQVVTLVDDKRGVYQAWDSNPTPKYLGQVETVFDGYRGNIDDLLQARLDVLGDTYIIREGEFLYSFWAVDGHSRFVRSHSIVATFVMSMYSLVPWERKAPPLTVINHGSSTILTIYEGFIYSAVLEGGWAQRISGLGIQIEDVGSSREKKYLGSYQVFFDKATSGLGFSALRFGLFHGERLYVYDFDAERVVERYVICKDESADFLFSNSYDNV